MVIARCHVDAPIGHKPTVIDWPRGLWLLCLALLTWPLQSGADPASSSIGDPAPPFSLVAIDDSRLSLADLRGKYVVLHFAATWCPFCNAEAPNLEQLHRKYRGRGVTALIIDVKEAREAVAKTAKKFGFSFPVLLDPDGAVARRYAPPPSVLPDLARDEVMIASNVIIDPQGRIRFMSVLDTANFDARLIQLQATLDGLLEGK